MPVKFACSLFILSLVLLLALGAPLAATAQDESEPSAETTEEAPTPGDAAPKDEELSGYAAFDAWFAENVNGFLNAVLFFPIGAEDSTDEQGNVIVRSMPFVVIVLFIGGFFLAMPPLLMLGIVLFTLSVFFTVITLPVEFNASSRALRVLSSGGYLTEEELAGARKVLNAAAMTYVAAAAVAISHLLRMVLLANRN